MTLDDLRARMERLDAAWRTKRDLRKMGANGITHDDVREAVAAYILASEEYQRARWGKVRLKLTVAGLLR